MSAVEPNFSIIVTWEHFIMLSLSQKQPNNIFPDIGGADYSWFNLSEHHSFNSTLIVNSHQFLGLLLVQVMNNIVLADSFTLALCLVLPLQRSPSSFTMSPGHTSGVFLSSSYRVISPTPPHHPTPRFSAKIKNVMEPTRANFHEILHLKEPLVGSLAFFHFGTEHKGGGGAVKKSHTLPT